jgi:hypothetical protein
MKSQFEARSLPWHMVRILGFRHNGKGLPVEYDFDLLTIGALSLAVGLLRWDLLAHAGHPLETAGQYLTCLFLYALFVSAARFTLMALAFIGTDLIASGLTYAGVNCAGGWICEGLIAWCVGASFVADYTFRKGCKTAR